VGAWCPSCSASCSSPAPTSARSPLAPLFGLFALIYGCFEIMMGIEVRRTGKTLDSVVKTAA